MWCCVLSVTNDQAGDDALEWYWTNNPTTTASPFELNNACDQDSIATLRVFATEAGNSPPPPSKK